MTSQETERKAAAEAAVQLVQDGMTVGLGTGGAAAFAIRALSERCAQGLAICGVPTSSRSADLARSLRIPLVELKEAGQIDLTIDGADEFDDRLCLTKGGGGALLREKIVAFHSKQVAIITDSAKHVAQLGRFPLPCEVLPFALAATKSWIEQRYQIDVRIRTQSDGAPFVTDQQNGILDCRFGAIADPPQVASELSRVPGLIEHGLFLGLAHVVYMGSPEGVQEFRGAP